MLNIDFTIIAVAVFLISPFAGYVFYHKLLKNGRSIKRTYNVEKDIPPEFGRKEFIAQTTKILCGVGGESCLEIFSPETVKALREAHERGVVISFITGPVQICGTDGKAPLIELSREGVIDLFYSNKRQQEHYWVSERQVFYEEPHEPAARIRTAYFFDDNAFEADYFTKKFKKALKSKDVMSYDSQKASFLLLTQGDFDNAKSVVRCKYDERNSGTRAFERCNGLALAEAMESSGISFQRA